MIELKNISKFYNDNKTVTVGLRNVSLKMNKGEFIAITGDSGSGKSTLLNVISSIDGYDEGEILFYGNETFYFNQTDSDAFRKNNVSFIFQKYNIVDSYTVLQNVMLPLIIKGKAEAEAKREAMEIIRRVGLESRADNKGTGLSGGEKQRCVIARALATDAPILACDEPTGNLDSKTSKEIIELIKEVSEDKLVLIVTHDYESIKDICTRKIKLSDGEVVEDITFADGVEEENRELNLEADAPGVKTLFKLASLNILSTPKKTVFSSLVFSFVSCVLLLLSLLMVKVSYEENYTYSESYGIISDNRAVIYSADHESLDMNALADALSGAEYYENAFYEEADVIIRVGEMFSDYASLTFHSIDYELISGSEPVNENDFIYVVPVNSYTNVYSSSIGEEISVRVNADYDYIVPIGTLVGTGVSEEINSPYLISNGIRQSVSNILINNDVSLFYESDSNGRNEIPKVYVKNVEKSYVAVPTALKDNITFDFNLRGIYKVSYDFDIVYTNEVGSPTLFVNDDFMRGKVAPSIDGVKEVFVYTDSVKALSKAVTKLGYNISIPSLVEKGEGANKIVLYFLVGVIFVALLIMFYISFAIIQRVYLTKTKDYSIFRTLGVVSRDLKKVLCIEVISIALASILIGAVLSNLIMIAAKATLYMYLSSSLVILYVLAMSAFGLFTALRLNNKIFKNSVYQSINEWSE